MTASETYQNEIVDYRNKDGVWLQAKIVDVSYDDEVQPYYTIYIEQDNKEKSTEASRLRKVDLTRLVIYSSNTPAKEDFAGMIKCQKKMYDFETDDLEALEMLITTAVATNGKPLKSIALACYGAPTEVGSPKTMERRERKARIKKNLPS